MDNSSLTVLLNVTSELIGADYESVLDGHCSKIFSDMADQNGEKNYQWPQVLGVMVCNSL